MESFSSLVPPLQDSAYNIITNLQLFLMDIPYLAQPSRVKAFTVFIAMYFESFLVYVFVYKQYSIVKLGYSYMYLLG